MGSDCASAGATSRFDIAALRTRTPSGLPGNRPYGAAYDDDIHPTEWIQATGTAPDRLTVEIKQSDNAGVHRLYTIGHPEAATETAETETIHNGDHEYRLRPAEVLTATEAIELFQHYYDTHTVPAGWHLREQPEFADTADGESD